VNKVDLFIFGNEFAMTENLHIQIKLKKKKKKKKTKKT